MERSSAFPQVSILNRFSNPDAAGKKGEETDPFENGVLNFKVHFVFCFEVLKTRSHLVLQRLGTQAIS